MNQREYDIVIIGAGSAGVAASVSASIENKSVLLLEKSNRIGGMATRAEVGTICGLYLNDDSPNFTYNVDDFTREFAESIRKQSNSTPITNSSGLKFLPYEVDVFENHCKSLLNENQIDIWLNTELKEVQVNGDQVERLLVKKENLNYQIKLSSIVDASGVNVVSKLAGLKLQSISYQQSLTHIFRIKNISFESEENLALILLFKTKDKFNLSIVPGSYSENEVALKFNFFDSSIDVQYEIQKLFSYLKANVIGFSKAIIKSIADETGCRIGGRAEGKYVLTMDDVIYCRKFENSSANGNWPIEIWKAKQLVEILPLQKNDFYQIPDASLKSKQFNNLFFAGRNISADEDAIASARVIATCLQTGGVAGKLAAN